MIESEFDFVTQYLALQINIIKNNFNVLVLLTFLFFFFFFCMFMIVSQAEETRKEGYLSPLLVG